MLTDLYGLTREQLVTALAGDSFRFFVEHFWPCVSNDPFKGGYLVDAVCEHLQAVAEGQIKRFVLACPIRHGKSILTSVLFPAFAWVRDPSLRIISASCGEDLAGRDSLRTRHLIQSPQYRASFGDRFALLEDQNTKLYYANDRNGHRKAVGTGTQTTGLDADWIITDDILDYKKAKSEAERRNAIEFFDTVLSKRIVHGTGKDRIVIAGHRVHEDDLFARVWNTWGNDGTWTYLVLPAEAKPSVTNSYFNATGWIDTRAEGELLNPERFSSDVLDQEKKSLRHEYHCLYQQDPSPADGDLFKAEWFRYYTDEGEAYNLSGKRVPKSRAWRYATVDTAVTIGMNSDYTVCQVWDVIDGNMILVDMLRKKLDGNRIVPALVEFFKVHRPQFVSVESEFVGRFVLDQLRNEGVVVKPFKAKGHGDKETRAVAAEIRMEAGRVWFPSGRPWLADLEREVLAFPNSAHDDAVDALSMAAILADKYTGTVEPELTPEEQEAREKEAKAAHFERMLWAGTRF